MATDIERLTVVLEANIKRYEREMARTRQVTDRAMRDVERRTQNSMRRLDAIMGGIGNSIKGAFAGVLAGLSVQQVTQFADSFIRVQNALKVAGLEGERLRSTYQAIFAIAQRQGAPLEAMAQLYGRLSQAQSDLRATGPEMLRVTEGVAMALKVQGTSASEASGALLQLGQALSGGKIQAEEYNSLLDGARPVLQAVAAGLVEAGGSVSKLTALVKDGKVSSEAFFRAFLAGMPVLEQQAASAAATTGQAWENVKTSMTNLVGELDKVVNYSGSTATALGKIAEAIDGISAAVLNAARSNKAYRDSLPGGANAPVIDPQEFQRSQRIQQLQGLLARQNGRRNSLTADWESELQGLIEQQRAIARSAQSAPAASAPALPSLTGAPAPKINPVSLSNFSVPGDDKQARAEKLNDYQREIKAIQERTAALQQEATTVGQSAGQVAAAKAEFELLAAAKEANVKITPALEADIKRLATAYGEATSRLEEARQAQESFVDLQNFIGQSLSGFFSDIVSGGENAEKSLMNLTKRLADMALQAALLGQGPLAGILGTAGANGGVGGLIGTLFKGLGFGTGKASGGSVYPGRAYTVGESGRETFVPTTPGRIVPHGKLGGSLQVVINNNAGAQVSTRQTEGPQGPRLEVQIEQVLGGMISDGRLDKPLRGRFGVSPMRGR